MNFGKFNGEKLISFQIKVFARNIKETTLAWSFIKVTARPSFRRLTVIRQINRVYYIIFCLLQNRKYVTKIQLYLLLI